MSHKVTTLIWDYYPNGGGEFLTALCLADHADPEGGSIYPSVSRISTKTQQAERTVQYHMQAMRQSGWLIKVTEGGGAGNPNEYRIPIELIPKNLSTRVQNLHPLFEAKGCNPEPKRVQSDPEKGATAIAPELVNVNRTRSNPTPVEKNQGQNRPAGPACAHCDGPLTGGQTRMRIGDVCNTCREDYMAGKWKLEAAA